MAGLYFLLSLFSDRNKCSHVETCRLHNMLVSLYAEHERSLKASAGVFNDLISGNVLQKMALCSFTFEPVHVCLLCQNRGLLGQFVHPQNNLYSALSSAAGRTAVPSQSSGRPSSNPVVILQTQGNPPKVTWFMQEGLSCLKVTVVSLCVWWTWLFTGHRLKFRENGMRYSLRGFSAPLVLDTQD